MSDTVKTLSDLPRVDITFEKISPYAKTPERKTKQSVGFDLCAVIPGNKTIEIPIGSSETIGTGLKVSMPEYLELQIRSRSGLAHNNQVFVLNSPGTIDPDYRDELKIILFNAGKNSFQVKTGDRIAQGVVGFVANAFFIEGSIVEADSNRTGGFGSTGV